MRTIAIVAVALAATFHLAALGSARAAEVECPPLGDYYSADALDQQIQLTGVGMYCTLIPGSDDGPGDPGEPVGKARIVQFVRVPLPLCSELDPINPDRECIPDADPWICPDGTPALGRGFERVLDALTYAVLVPWHQVDPGGCPLPPDFESWVTEYFTTVQLAPATAGRNPDGAEGVVNLPLNLYADPAPQVLDTVLGGWPIQITATPITYTWDLGPAGLVETTDPGGPYPQHTVLPVITVLGEIPITLTTSWIGSFRVGGTGGVYPINGVATTVTTLDPITITEARTYLVTENY